MLNSCYGITSCATGAAARASSLDHLCSHQRAGLGGRRRDGERIGGDDDDAATGPMSPSEEDGGGGGAYGAFTLPCRRSHCLSEGPAGLGLAAAAPPHPVFQGRRAQTTQVNKFESSLVVI